MMLGQVSLTIKQRFRSNKYRYDAYRIALLCVYAESSMQGELLTATRCCGVIEDSSDSVMLDVG